MREEEKKVFINLAGQQSMFVGNLIQQSMNSYLAGNIDDWYWKLNGVREMIHHDLSVTESEDLDIIEKEITTFQNCWRKIPKLYLKGIKPDKETIKKSSEFPKKVRKYQRELMMLLKKQGYFPDKENRKKISF